MYRRRRGNNKGELREVLSMAWENTIYPKPFLRTHGYQFQEGL
jgi:hypothetical protein